MRGPKIGLYTRAALHYFTHELLKGEMVRRRGLFFMFFGLFSLLPQEDGRCETRTSGLVVLLTDFGETGYLLGVLKGAIYTAAPNVRIDSITNNVRRFDVEEGSFILGLSATKFPTGTVFLTVVDPQVSPARKWVVVETKKGHLFVAPDNGLLTHVVREEEMARAFLVEPKERNGPPFSSVEIYGPLAAKLAMGFPLEKTGRATKEIVLLNFAPATVKDKTIKGAVMAVDSFGNLLTNIGSDLMEAAGMKPGDKISVFVGTVSIQATFAKHLGDVSIGEYVCIPGSEGEVLIAINQGNLAKEIKARRGEPIFLTSAVD